MLLSVSASLVCYLYGVVHGCWTKFKQNPRLEVSMFAPVPSLESVWTYTLNGGRKPEIKKEKIILIDTKCFI